MRPELLAPAGNLEKLKTAIYYGADAVYCSGQEFGLRAASDNLSLRELEEAASFVHQQEKKIYVVLNGFLFDEDLERLPDFLQFLTQIKIDAVIVSDLGVLKTVKESSPIPVHLSTQASCLNQDQALFWKDQGASRLILGREVTLPEAAAIKNKSGLEIEMFIHGSMCMSYSGHCTISNYTMGRDSNRGGCAHSCRFEYELQHQHKDKKVKSFFMSSKDLNGLGLLQQFSSAGIDSIKVEGRMKSKLYAATISSVYSQALDLLEKGEFTQEQLGLLELELKKISHRDYTQASLLQKAGKTSIYSGRTEDDLKNYVGDILESQEDAYTLFQAKKGLTAPFEFEVLPFNGRPLKNKVNSFQSLEQRPLNELRPGDLCLLPYIAGAKAYNIVRELG